MNKNARAPIFCAATIISLLFFSCGDFSGLSVPEKVSIKTSAQYSAALGQKYFDLTEKLGTQMLDEVSQKAKADVYKYVPDPSDTTLKYLLHRKLYDVQLNVGEYVDSMELEDSLANDFNFTKELTLPEIKASITPISIPVDFSADVPFSLPEATLTLDEVITEAVIGEGSIVIKAEGEAAGCYSVYDGVGEGEFTLEGITKYDGSAYSESDFAAGSGSGTFIINQELSLSGAKITIPAGSGQHTIPIRASGKLVKGSGDITAAGTLNITLQIKSLSTVKADLSKVGKFVMSDSENTTPIPSEMVAHVQKIEFGEDDSGVYYKRDKDGNVTTTKSQGKGIKFKAINSLPAGNDLILNVDSTTFGISSSETVEAKANGAAFEKSVAEFGAITVTSSVFGTKEAPRNIQFSVTLSDDQTFTNLEMGKTYKIGVSDAKLLFDWDKVDIKLNNPTDSVETVDMSDFTIDELLDGINNSEIKTLINHSELIELPVYFLVQKPTGALADLVSGITFNGKIYLTYTEASEPEYIVGSSGAAASLSLCEPMLWPSLDKVVTKKFETIGTDYSFYKDIADVLNKRAANLEVNYNISVSGGSVVDLYKARLDSMSSSDTCDIAVEMAAVLPLKFKTTAATEMDIYELANMDVSDKADLLDRKDVSKTEDYEENASSIKYLHINYNLINSALEFKNASESWDATIDIADTQAGYTGITKTIHVTGNNQSDDVVDFTPDEIKKVMTHFFKPTMKMTIANGVELKVLRHAVESPTALGINPVITLKLDENSPIDVKDLIKK